MIMTRILWSSTSYDTLRTLPHFSLPSTLPTRTLSSYIEVKFCAVVGTPSFFNAFSIFALSLLATRKKGLSPSIGSLGAYVTRGGAFAHPMIMRSSTEAVKIDFTVEHLPF